MTEAMFGTTSISCSPSPAAGRRSWLRRAALGLMVLPFVGCQLVTDPNGNGNGNSNSGGGNGNANDNSSGSPIDRDTVGYFINNQVRDKLLIAGRAASGDEFFVFGTRTAQNFPERVEYLLVINKDGQNAFIEFDDDGWPVFARGFDRSFVEVDYLIKTQAEIVANLDIRDETNDLQEVVPVTFNGRRTARQVSDAVFAETSFRPVLPVAPTTNPRSVRFEEAGVAFEIASDDDGKFDEGRFAPVRVGDTLFQGYVVGLIPPVEFAITILGEALLSTWDNTVEVEREGVLSAYAPIFFIGPVINGSFERIEFASLNAAFEDLPPQPTRPRD